jgi:hypothetical protein
MYGLLTQGSRLRRQKNRDGLAWFARRASAWLLRKVKEHKSVKAQAQEETCKTSGNWKVRDTGEVGVLHLLPSAVMTSRILQGFRGWIQ